MIQGKRFTTKDFPETVTVAPHEEQYVVEEGFTFTPASKTTTFHVGAGGHLIYSFNLHCPGNVARSIALHLEKDAHAELYGIVFAHGKQKIALKLSEEHVAQSSKATTSIHNLVDEHASVDIRDIIGIRKGAKFADTRLDVRSLVLTKDARAQVIPSLEIEEQDVKASHAAAAGPIDPEQMFYLESRGYTTTQAHTALIRGFLDAILSKLPKADQTTTLLLEWNSLMHETA